MKHPFTNYWILFYALALMLVTCNNDRTKSQIGSYIITQKHNSIEIPFTFYGMNIMVAARINNMDVNLLVDNGVMWDELWFYGNDQVDSMNLVYNDEEIDIVGAGEGDGVSSRMAICTEISFDDVIFLDQPALVSPKEDGFYKMFPEAAGQLCGMFFRNFITEFDFKKNLIRLYEEKDFNPDSYPQKIAMTPDSSGAYSILVGLTNGDNTVRKNLFIDLGGIYPLSLVVSKDFPVDTNQEKKYLGHGASGPIYGYESTISSIEIAGYELIDISGVFVEDQDGGDHTNLTLGLPLLKNFNLVFDYFNNYLYLKPNELNNESMKLK